MDIYHQMPEIIMHTFVWESPQIRMYNIGALIYLHVAAPFYVNFSFAKSTTF